jgi:hypothetical protein
MILVETKVISEPLRKTPDPVVIEWVDRNVVRVAAVREDAN